jgi:BirA family biotin operon repressor/biotin-[acetyl-CoA-carboxylase] ligase
LRNQGFSIGANIRKGYCLKEIPDKLLPPLIQTGLRASVVAREIYYFSTIDSTNRVAKEYALFGVSDGALVIAEEQTSGKGRMNRVWVSPARSSVLCSLIFYTSINPSSVFRLTMLASIAVVRAINKACGIVGKIKWPNDVYIDGKKVCGILTEFLADHDSIRYVVIGIGINVNFDIVQHPEIKGIATCLKEAKGQKVSRLTVLKTLLEEIDTLYQDLVQTGGEDLRKEWERHSMVLNRQVKIFSGEEVTCGFAKGVSEDGHLILVDHKGNTREVICGDLSLRF